MAKAPTVEDRLATMEGKMSAQGKIIEDQKNIIDVLKSPKGIKSANEMRKLPKVVFTSDQKAERELRRYIKNAGVVLKSGKKCKAGFRKNLSDELKERANKLMKLLGRKEMVWDESLLDFRNHQPVTGEE